MRGAELVDFEKVNSLEGVFLANKFEDERTTARDKFVASKRVNALRQATIGDKEDKEFTETEIESQSIMKARMSQGNNRNVNKKQKATQDAVKRESAGQNDDRKKMVSSIRTHITHNKGGRWELIKAPTIDSEGKKVNCYLDEDCSLHLQIYSSDGLFAPPYS